MKGGLGILGNELSNLVMGTIFLVYLIRLEVGGQNIRNELARLVMGAILG